MAGSASVLLLDNYDSFTYNLFQYLSELGATVEVARNDAITVPEIEAMAPQRIVISPGPKTPAHAGVSVDVVRHFARSTPILGVCLGHQCIGAAFDARIVRAGEIMHGKSSPVRHDGRGVYAGLPNPFDAIRYHSLAIDPDSLPEELIATSWSDSGVLMGVRHTTYDIEGVQFHPESIKTDAGKDLLRNFLAERERVR
jgi:anthranilate synthase/aminodeoxychorismate synthase-like glutamine amidotransferase